MPVRERPTRGRLIFFAYRGIISLLPEYDKTYARLVAR
jgi:hypothetical protein